MPPPSRYLPYQAFEPIWLLSVDERSLAAKKTLAEDLVQVLGYLNFSSGRIDPKTLSAFNRIYVAALPGTPFEGLPAWLQIQQWLQDELARLAESNSAFGDCEQAEVLLELVWLNFLPAYLDFHKDLLFHQEPEGIFNGFFLGRAVEAVLQQGEPWGQVDRIVEGAIRKLNDYVGYRPVAVLEGRRLEPYGHEWVRPVPLWTAGIGTANGLYHDVIEKCMDILQATDADILRQASFDLNMLEELSLDPRAYDFDHPVNQRPNYHFGQWDPHRIDNAGNYRRFVVQQVTIDALLARVHEDADGLEDELLFEAAAVLAGTILMASGISGGGPGAFASTVSVASLMGPIAAYRDEFYNQLLTQLQGNHRERLFKEHQIRRQPFGGARQHLNTYLAKHRACQLEHVHLARLFARMGNEPAAKEQSDVVPVPSARIVSRIDCLMTAADNHLQLRQVDKAAEISPQIMDWVERGIQCGAIVDPWNILGFSGNFARFEGPDSAVHDHRVDDLVQIMEYYFALQSRIWREASASGRTDLCKQLESQMRQATAWWRKYAAYEVSDVEATDPLESLESAVLVAKALQLWHAGDASSGDVRFWAPHAELFDSPKAYALVVESLLERNDFVASMALLVHWLGQADRVGLQKGDDSFSELARRWMQRFEHRLYHDEPGSKLDWSVAQKFFDYLEANAGDYWEPPVFALGSRGSKPGSGLAGTLGDDFDEHSELVGYGDDEEGIFDAAYENVIYNDTTDDGVDSDVPEEDGGETTTELVEESNRLNQHLTFLNAVAQMWKGAAVSRHLSQEIAEQTPAAASRLESMEGWAAQAAANRHGLLVLLQDVAAHRIPKTSADHEAMSRYDRQRLVKESLLERIIATAVETADARRLLLAKLCAVNPQSPSVERELSSLPQDDRSAIELVGKLIQGEHDQVKSLFPRLFTALRSKKLLYIPLARGGDPALIYSVRLRRRIMSHLLVWLPRQGFFDEACQLIETARFMEHHNPIGPGAVTEFDDLFELCFVSMVRAAVQNAVNWRHAELVGAGKVLPPLTDLDFHDGESLGELEPRSDALVAVLERLTEVMLGSWLAHSRTLRLSALETVDNSRSWTRLVDFIKRFGGELFTQSFLRLGNVRAILHQGVGHWLDQLVEEGYEDDLSELFAAIEAGEIERSHVEKLLSVVLEAVIDHYSEYRDYNSTTTQSDRGEMLYMLLDFLRLRVRYDRVSWNLKPIYWTHEVLVRAGCHQTALQWRRALAERIGRESESYLENLQQLQSQYAMRMPTVSDRLHERFTRPMTVDRMRALVGPAVRQFRETGATSSVFELLIDECKLMMEQPTGVGLDVPQWLSDLEDEVDSILESQRGFFQKPRSDNVVAFREMSSEEILAQLATAARNIESLNLPSE
ncbi:hypothetical protein [Aureliella helgolandensis]|uniref:Uncharacterized protein n=1 Tax=Aureliella helgolandensis TaxID=2527968 RepID=A0A518G103_9BACT|nr:hypothetical protein [Aureliella helgolandensis]QDV22279.1 hypothetical protein Q31a_05630 [Aureliella helgolandensis]